MSRSNKNQIAAVAALLALAPTFATAQARGAENLGGMQIDVGLSTGLRYDSNLSLGPESEAAAISDTGLRFAFSTVTSTQRLEFDAEAVLRFIDLAGETDFGLEDPRLGLSYERQGADSRLSFDATYHDVDLDFLDPGEDPAAVGEDGSLAALSADLVYEFGLDAPFGMAFALHHDDSDYSDTTDPDLYDRATDRATAKARLRLSPVNALTLGASRERFDADDAGQTDRTTTGFTAGLRHERDAATTVEAEVGYTDITTREFGSETALSGLTGKLEAIRQLPRGRASVRIATALDTDGRRSELVFGRDVDVPTGRFSATLGASRGPQGDVDAIGSLEYSRTLPSGELTASISRSAYADDDADSVLDTRARLEYRHQVNSLSRLDFALAWSLTQDTDGGVANDTEFAMLAASYSRELTSEWNLTGGVVLRQRDDTFDGKADSSAIFATLSRDFTYRP